MSLLRIEDLGVEFATASGSTRVVDGVSLSVDAGERVALVGESGSGKSVTAMSVLRLNIDASYQGRILFEGRDLLALSEREMRGIRGREVAMIFQEPMTALNPLYPVGDQIGEVLSLHEGLSGAQARERTLDLLARVQIREPGQRIDAYPHQLSGGQRQRVMIAMALACRPRLLIADEPTTALDVTVRQQIMELLLSLQAQDGMAILLITHDLPLVKRFAQRVAVMQGGRLVEVEATESLFESPTHPYTRRLLASRPRRLAQPLDAARVVEPGGARAAAPAAPVLSGEQISCAYSRRVGWWGREPVPIVTDVDLALARGETLGIVGESGSGKTTLGLSLLRLSSARSTGAIRLDGQRIDGLGRHALRPLRRRMQVVFQDPFTSLSPRMTVESLVGEGLALHQPDLGEEALRARVEAALIEVDLKPAMMSRYPHEFSGGQRQRIAIARAVILQPELLLLDEPTSALDVSVQIQVLELLAELQQRHGLSYLLITHDLAVIQAMAHRLLVMKDGRVIEAGETGQVFAAPREAYTQTLLQAALF